MLSQYKALKAVSEENRKIGLNDIWFQLIPFFNLYWWFVVVNRLSASFAAEYDKLQISHNELYPTRAAGIVTPLLYFLALIPFDELKTIATLGWFLCFIIYWVQVYKCGKLILANKEYELLDVEREALDKTS
ncbi:hypothetical protein [Lacibacter sediminis]|uniref:DUF4328 domain-containing protein n=1 Tax=Lacibacter sediminis TaxID=2760713 RepID=A0A7G5XAX5_9BACT|nr:hypothetical protein [Lacibacter sediminis]QNA42628.1 hypothetical protein H4075_10960 [Lacibacter sediminis]